MSNKRRFSLEGDFMNYNTDDLLFGAMYHLSTYHPVEKKLYLSKKNLLKNKKTIYELCDLDAQKLKRHLNKLIEKKLIAEEKMLVGGENIPVYIFPYNYDGNYQLVDNEMLWYLASTRNHQSIRIYVHLLRCYLWKKKDDDFYTFTNTDLLTAIGYSKDNKIASSMISNILESFQREGIINYVEYYDELITHAGVQVPTPKKRLMFVAQIKNDLKSII